MEGGLLLPVVLETYRTVEDEVVRCRVWVNIVVADTLELEVVERLASGEPLLHVCLADVEAVWVEEWTHGIDTANIVVLLAVVCHFVAWVLYHPEAVIVAHFCFEAVVA